MSVQSLTDRERDNTVSLYTLRNDKKAAASDAKRSPMHPHRFLSLLPLLYLAALHPHPSISKIYNMINEHPLETAPPTVEEFEKARRFYPELFTAIRNYSAFKDE